MNGGDSLKGDVESWIKSPGENFGWIILGDETKSPTAKRFISRNSNDHDFHPRLTVEYSSNSPTPIKNTPWSRIKAKKIKLPFDLHLINLHNLIYALL